MILAKSELDLGYIVPIGIPKDFVTDKNPEAGTLCSEIEVMGQLITG